MTTGESKQEWSTALGWEKWHDWLAANMRPLTEWLCGHAGIESGGRVLDVACGTGLPAIEAALRVRPAGKVVGIDVSNDMLAACGRLAKRAGLNGELELRQMDAMHLELPDASFDAVTCGFCLMFLPDPVRAAAEMMRVLRPGGRLAISVWGPPPENPFFTTVFGAVAQVVTMPPTDPGAPGMWRLAAPGELEHVLREAGLADIVVESLPLAMETPSVTQQWQMFTDVAPPVHNAVTNLPPADVTRLEHLFAEAIAPFTVDGKVRVRATPLCGAGRKPHPS